MSDVAEEEIKQAVESRKVFFLNNLETMTMKQVRRVLEEDLELPQKSLDRQKDRIAEMIDELLATSKELVATVAVAPDKPAKQASAGQRAGKPRTTVPPKAKREKVATAPRKRAQPAKRGKGRKNDSEDDNDDEEGDSDDWQKPKLKRRGGGARSDNDSEQDEEEEEERQDAGARKARKRTEAAAPGRREKTAHSVQVDKLKRVCQDAAIRVPPTVYSRHRGDDDALCRALEELLHRYGLSVNSSTDQIRRARREIETSRELDGIDLGNIIGERPRRAAAKVDFSAVLNPKYPKPEDEDKEEDEDEDDESDEDAEADSGDDSGSDEDWGGNTSNRSARRSSGNSRGGKKQARRRAAASSDEEGGDDNEMEGDIAEEEEEEEEDDNNREPDEDRKSKGRGANGRKLKAPVLEDQGDEDSDEDLPLGKVAQSHRPISLTASSAPAAAASKPAAKHSVPSIKPPVKPSPAKQKVVDDYDTDDANGAADDNDFGADEGTALVGSGSHAKRAQQLKRSKQNPGEVEGQEDQLEDDGTGSDSAAKGKVELAKRRGRKAVVDDNDED